MAAESQFISIIDKLSEHLTLLKEDGVQVVEVDRVTLAGLANTAAPPASTASQAPRAPSNTPGATPAAPRKAAQPVFHANLQFALAERMAACGDATPSALHRLALLSDAASFTGGPGELLGNILKAGGYELISEPAAFTALSDILPHAPRTALLMGESALQAIRPGATMMLVRGKFKAVDGLDTFSTFNTSYIEKHSGTKKAVWSDIKTLLERLDLDLPDWVQKKK